MYIWLRINFYAGELWLPLTLMTVFVGPVKNPNKFNIFTLVKFDSNNFDLPLTLIIFYGPVEEILCLL